MRILLVFFLGIPGVPWPGTSAQADVLTANYGNDRTNGTGNENVLNPNDVNPAQFGKVAARIVDGQIYAQPLYVHALEIPGKAPVDVLFVATMHNSVYALDANDLAGVPIWKLNLGPSVRSADFDDLPGHPGAYTDIEPEIGILSTPVIDRASGTIYLAVYTGGPANHAYYLHALSLADGSEKFNGPVLIQAAVGGGDGALRFDPNAHLQRPGLLLANGSVYVAFGSHADSPPWYGWLMAYDASDLSRQTGVFNTSPNQGGSSIWQGGRGLAADGAGDIYLSTGNGGYDASQAWGQSVLRLASTGADRLITVADYFTPSDWDSLNAFDTDLGSNGPVLIPGTDLLYAIGKEGVLYLLNRDRLGHQSSLNGQTVQTFQATDGDRFAVFNSAFMSAPSGGTLFLWAYQEPLRAFRFANGVFETSPFAFNSTAPDSSPFSGLAVSSSGGAPGTGILWATSTNGAQGIPGHGTLRAFDAANVARELWNSDMNAGDPLGTFMKFANPVVADGKVFISSGATITYPDQIVEYGLLPGAAGIRTVVNSASFRGGPICAGELVTLFGNGIGPETAVTASPGADGAFPAALAGTEVTFDGVPASLLYAAPGQINLVAPNSLAGRSETAIAVHAPNGRSYAFMAPVARSAPAIFSPAGSGAILNEPSLSVNTPLDPAPRGGYVAIYVTGAGAVSNTLGAGSLAPLANPPRLASSVEVFIGGVRAEVTYAGASPGLVLGLTQIDVRVPMNTPAGAAVPVTVAVDGVPAQNAVTMAVQ